MNATEIETNIRTVPTADSIDGGCTIPIAVSDTDIDLQDTPTIKPVCPADDLTLPLKAKAPPVENPYSPANAICDISCVAYALELFLASHMLESEDYLHIGDLKKERLYFATGYGLIQCVKALMSYDDDDLLAAIDHTRHGNHIAQLHRKKTGSYVSRLAGYVIGSDSSGVGFIKSMTMTERHAELTYAESLFEKALLGIVYSGDWLAFVKEALNMRTTIGVYKSLLKFLDTADAEAEARGEGMQDQSIDPHFRSGVYLGNGVLNLILSLMPGKLQTLAELFGYKGDRQLALRFLSLPGGWTKDSVEPSVAIQDEGVRRSICDMMLLIFHLVLSSFTFDGVDIAMAQKILDWNLRRYPNGVFFLFGGGRLALCRSQPQKAIDFYTKAHKSQSQYRNLHHISFWEIAIANFCLWDIPGSLVCWRDLQAEATWSKSCYSYGMAACLLEIGGTNNVEEASKLMEKVPGLRQKIAGKSIPLEKFVARKARKFQSQGRLALPVLELAYLFLGIAHAPRAIVADKMLPRVNRLLTELKRHEMDPKQYERGQGYYDDLCLGRFLEGVCCRYIAYPDPDAIVDQNDNCLISKTEAVARAKAAFEVVFTNGPKIELEHHLVYHAHYELGRLLSREGDEEAARTQFDLVLSGKSLEATTHGRKGKYSMEQALHMRTHAAIDALGRHRPL
ncbi:hypothetical protein PILCRDRAFT_827932 [Piloderma croceum F 1598]|uniref:Tetratricopeptide repeat protein 39B n=1 Tax=Piloderma croceum (strain F 1598) TaxID=765440 RepID=A0A0C3F3W6_PILCF|nr:hypothetical protein PILCRDRAFT_827932 [Piloderma croceum F 1598]